MGSSDRSPGRPWNRCGWEVLKAKASFLSRRWMLHGAKTCSCRLFLARSNLFFPLRNPSFSGSNKRNKERAGKFLEGQGIAETNCPTVTSFFIAEKCDCLGSETACPSSPFSFTGPWCCERLQAACRPSRGSSVALSVPALLE